MENFSIFRLLFVNRPMLKVVSLVHLVGFLTAVENHKSATVVFTQTDSNRSHCETHLSFIELTDENSATSEKRTCCYWNEDVEDKVKRIQIATDNYFPDNLVFTKVLRGCGRLKNRLLITETNEKFCARYRDNSVQMQGEAYSNALASLLHIRNILPIFIIQINSTSMLWRKTWNDLKHAGWRHQSVVILTPWIENLQPVNASKNLVENASESVLACVERATIYNLEEASFMLQWSNMVILDYLTGNLDRLVSHFYNLKWDKHSFNHPIHNLKKTFNGFLLYLDNESGFGHSYRLMEQYNNFHEASLEKNCMFQKSTIKQLRHLHSRLIADLEKLLMNSIKNLNLLPRLTQNNLEMLKKRLDFVVKYCIAKCAL